jgi:outer membrane protein assembly factor BamB
VSGLFRPRRTVLGAALLLMTVLSACGAPPPGDSWPGISSDGRYENGRYVDAQYVYVADTEFIYRVKVEKSTSSNLTIGTVDWTANTPNKAHMYAPPALGSDGTVYVGAYDFDMYAFSPTASPRNISLGSWDSPKATDKFVGPALVYNGLVYAGLGDRGIVAYDAKSGAQKFAYMDTKFGIWSKPVIDESTGTLYVTSLDHNLYALDANTLGYKWQLDLGGAIAGTPLLDNGKLYVGTFSNELIAVDLSTQAITNRFPTQGWVWAPPIIDNGVLYFADLAGKVYAMDVVTWTKKWDALAVKENDPTKNKPAAIRGRMAVVRSSVNDKDETLYLIAGGDDKVLYSFNATTGQYICGNTANDRIISDIIVIGDDAIFATLSPEQSLAGYNITTCQQTWKVRKEDITRLVQQQ